MREIQPTPEGMHTVTPHLVCAGAAEAIEFYKKAFDALEIVRLPVAKGTVAKGTFSTFNLDSLAIVVMLRAYL